MTDWPELCRSLLGEKIAGIVWMPITADTPQLAAELQTATFSFSGAVHLRFESQACVRFSWKQVEYRFALSVGDEAAWLPHSLDRLQAQGDHWFPLYGSTIVSVELFTVFDDPNRHVAGAKFETSSGRFWIGAGGADFIGDHDDLWIGVGCDPPNRCDLISVAVVD